MARVIMKHSFVVILIHKIVITLIVKLFTFRKQNGDLVVIEIVSITTMACIVVLLCKCLSCLLTVCL
jgi:hypothetical protein